MNGKEPAIRVVNLEKSFNGNRVLKGVNLDIAGGEITVIIGPSGSGKSVLIKHIIGLLRPDSGEVFVEGKAIFELEEAEFRFLRKKFGMLFQQSALFDSMTVLENITFPLQEHTSFPAQKMTELAIERLELLGLHNVENKYPAELSGGMKKRVALARATILNPSFIIYDEPTTGLDPIMCENVDDMILTAQRKFNVTSIVITHDMASTFRIANKIAVIYDGTIVEEGSPSELKASRNEVVNRFISLSGISPL